MVAMWNACRVLFYFVFIFGISVPPCSAGVQRFKQFSTSVVQNADPSIKDLATKTGYRLGETIPAEIVGFVELPLTPLQTNFVQDVRPSRFDSPKPVTEAPFPVSSIDRLPLPQTDQVTQIKHPLRTVIHEFDDGERVKFSNVPRPNLPDVIGAPLPSSHDHHVPLRHPSRTIVHEYDDIHLTPTNPNDPVVLKHPTRTVIHHFDDDERRTRNN